MLSCRDARELVEEKLARSDRLVNLGELKTEAQNRELRRYIDRSETQYATPEMIRLELATHRAAEVLARRSTPAAKVLVEEALQKYPTIKPDQAEAVRYLCSGANLRLCTGDAGTGKSFMLGVCRDVWQAEGRRVYGCALAGAAAQELQESSGIKSTTIHSTLKAIKRGEIRLDNSVLVLDEAGMVGSRLFYRLLREAVRAENCRLVAVGDAKQLQPIEAGWIFKRLAQVHGEARLTKVIRQEVPWQLEAGRMMGRGETLEALTDYLVAGRLSVGRTKRDVIAEIVSQWERDGGVKESRDKLILAGLNSDVRELNLKCQAARLRAGEIDPERKVFFESVFLHEGDRIQFSKRLTKHKIENSWVGSVEEVDAERGRISVRLDKGDRLVTLRLKDFEKTDALRLGYASTTHKAQGRTVDLCYVLAGGPLSNRHLAYVQTTRHRKDARLYFAAQDAGPELRVAARALAKAEDKSLAVEVIEQHRRQREIRRERGMSLGL
jgi:ATP-dependent exoDNAse (exonuclease V) alpha subunit